MKQAKQSKLSGGNLSPKHNRIKIQYVCPEQKISKQALTGYREVRSVTSFKGEGVRVQYFDGGIEWFADNTLVFVLK